MMRIAAMIWRDEMMSRIAVLSVLFVALASMTLAQSNPRYIQFTPGAVK